jgi:enoyl-CoA hydratase/carnithine racemase
MSVERDETTVLREIAGGVATLFLNRPERHNSWIPAMEQRLFDLMDECERDPSVRAVVLTGSGASFCPGVDMTALSPMSKAATPADASWRSRPMTHVLSMSKPTIAAINGACAGVGFVQALSCDVRFAATGAKIAPAFTRRGLPAEFGVSWLLIRLIGMASATELLLSSRVVVAEEAVLLAEAQAYAHDLAQFCSPRAMSAVKEQLALEWSRGLDDSAADAARRLADPDLRLDFKEGVAAFVERRSPRFRPLP